MYLDFLKTTRFLYPCTVGKEFAMRTKIALSFVDGIFCAWVKLPGYPHPVQEEGKSPEEAVGKLMMSHQLGFGIDVIRLR
jgi:hypothetical protein